MTNQPSKLTGASAEEVDQAIADLLMAHRRLDCPYGDDPKLRTPLCSCGMFANRHDPKVYDWQHRLHVAALLRTYAESIRAAAVEQARDVAVKRAAVWHTYPGDAALRRSEAEIIAEQIGKLQSDPNWLARKIVEARLTQVDDMRKDTRCWPLGKNTQEWLLQVHAALESTLSKLSGAQK